MNDFYDGERRRREFEGQEADFIRTEISLGLTFLERKTRSRLPAPFTSPGRPAPEVLNIMRSLEGQGISHRAIARELNRLNIKTGRGCQWHGVTVKAAFAAGEQRG